jgi:hypothetical protein
VSPQDKWALALIPIGLIVAFLAVVIFIGKGH